MNDNRQDQVHRLDFSERGTPEERAAHSIEIYESLSNARKRANYLLQIARWSEAYDKEPAPMTPEEFKTILDSIFSEEEINDR